MADQARSKRAEGTVPAGGNVAEFSVGELAFAIKRALEDGFGYVRLRGEISGYRGPHASGHCYFALKDDKAKIDAVIWRGVFGRLKVKPEEGMEVIAQGKVTSYPNASKYQIVIETLEPAGVGALMALLEERKRKLGAEGLFDDARKRPLPFLPRVVGIVTSPTGAVIRDMLAGFTERFPTRVIVWPVRVQGETSASEVAAAIRGFSAFDPDGPLPRPDTLIVARGGGSLEDLWSFNEEEVVRAAADSRIPLIAAVGHETDWTLIDLVADARAPTPTKAAEWAVPMYSELTATVEDKAARLKHAARRTLEAARAELRAAARGLPRLEDLLTLPRQRFDAIDQRLGRALIANTAVHQRRFSAIAPRVHPRLVLSVVRRGREQLTIADRRLGRALITNTGAHQRRFSEIAPRLNPRLVLALARRGREQLDGQGSRLDRAFANRIRLQRRALDGMASLLRTLSYQSVLERGFVLVRDEAGQAVRSADAAAPGQRINLEFADGVRVAEVIDAPPERRKISRTTTEGPGAGVPTGDPDDGLSREQTAEPVTRRGVKSRSASENRAQKGRQGRLF